MLPLLDVTQVEGTYSWTWRLSDETGRVLVEQPVRLDPEDPSLAIARDLYRNLWRIETDPRQGFLVRIGEFVEGRIFGGVGRALVERAPVTVRVSVPRTAMHLLALPFELAPLAGVTFCYDPGGAQPPAAHPGTPRVLAIFALPAESSALALARERRMLDAQFAGYGDTAELRVLQYGATRRVIAEALSDPAGWDIVHISGHGRAGQLFLERDDDSRDRVTAAELVDLLASAPRPPGLVVLSTCESGAARVLHRRGRLGRSSTDLVGLVQGESGNGSDNLGYEVAGRLGCAVLAMRYPVDDDFSVALSRLLYTGLLVDGAAIDEVLRTAIPAAATSGAPLSAATPMLFGDPSFRLAPDRPVVSVRPEPAEDPGLPSPPELFVGRSSILARVLQLRAQMTVLVGMPGVGKTACMAEAVALYRDRGGKVVWHKLHPGETAEELQVVLRDAVADHDAMVALDNADAAPHLGDLLASLPLPGTGAQLILTSRRRMPELPSADHIVVPLLSRTESELLERQLDEQRWIETGHRPAGRSAWPWKICRGHPALIHHRGTGEVEARAWEVFTPVPIGRPVLPPDHPGTPIQSWALDQSTMLAAAPRLLWQFLSSLETADRHEEPVAQLWPLVCAERGIQAEPLANTFEELTRQGLAQRWDPGGYLLHPAVAMAGRRADPDIEGLAVGLLAAVWDHRYQQGSQTGEAEDALAHAAASAVPYLMRLRRWEHASTRCEEAINHDRSPDMAARLLPFLNEIVQGQPDARKRRASRYVRAVVLVNLDAQRAQEELEQIYAEATGDHDARAQLAAATALAGLQTHRDPHEAADWIRRAADSYGGDLSAVPLVRLKRARIAYQLGDYALARDEAMAVLEELDRTESHDDVVRVNRTVVRVDAMELAAAAHGELGDRNQQRALREQIDRVLTRRGAADRAQAMAQFNRLAADVRDGARTDTIAELLLAARSEFLNPADRAELALVLMALAKLEDRRRNHSEAVALAYQALRSTYAAGEPLTAATAHEDLAELLAHLRPVPDHEVAVHLLANAVIRLRAAGLMLALHPPATLLRALAMLTFRLARRPDGLPRSYADLSGELAAKADVDLDALLAGTERIPIHVDPETGNPVLKSGSDEPGDSVDDALVWAKNWPRPADLRDPDGHPEHWREIIDMVAGGRTPTADVEEILNRLRAAGWERLADALGCLIRGEEVADDLDATDQAIVRMVRDRVTD